MTRPLLHPLRVAAVGICVCAAPATAQEQASAPTDTTLAARCQGPEHRQLDFWLGSWEVRDSADELLGHNVITRVSGGCALLENWSGAAGGSGVSINTYDASLGRWSQRWVGAGATLWLEGGMDGGAMVLAGTAPRATPRGSVLDRITWTPLPDGRVRQVWDISSDDGGTWVRSFAGYYVRRAPAPSGD
ncbi:MAG: hypothetical protein WEB88_08155 [Gemmatimonadota bacterium]